MNRPSSFSLRGRRALVAIKDERDLSIVRRQFERLGIDIFAWEPGGALECHPDVALIDDEFLPLTSSAQRALPGRCPVIALLGTETPSRLKLVLELDPASFLVKPLRSAGIYAALVMMPLAEMLPLGSNGCASGRGPAERSNKPPGIKTQIIVIQRQRWTSRATPPFPRKVRREKGFLRGMPGDFWSTQSCLLRIGPDMGIDYCL